MKYLSTLLIALFASLMLVGCEADDGPVEETGEAVDEAIEDAGEATEDVTQNIEDEAEDLTD